MTQPTEAEQPRILLLASEQNVHAFDPSDTARIAIGRHDSNDLQLRSRTVSNYHAEILYEGNDPLLRDLGSTNGTYVNEESIEQEERAGQHESTEEEERAVTYESTDGRERPFFCSVDLHVDKWTCRA